MARSTNRSKSAQKKSKKREPKRPKNLTLDPEAVARGEHYGARHGASLSQLVSSFLYALPRDDGPASVRELSPSVRRLYGVAAKATADRETYREHLAEKYGGR